MTVASADFHVSNSYQCFVREDVVREQNKAGMLGSYWCHQFRGYCFCCYIQIPAKYTILRRCVAQDDEIVAFQAEYGFTLASKVCVRWSLVASLSKFVDSEYGRALVRTRVVHIHTRVPVLRLGTGAQVSTGSTCIRVLHVYTRVPTVALYGTGRTGARTFLQ